MWYNNAVFYQFYPLGTCDALEAPRDKAPRIRTLSNYIPHLTRLGVTAVYLSPVFASDYHGYDTEDYLTVDPRLGTNNDLKEVVKAFHEAGIRVVLDGVFNHVGRNFGPFQDVREKKWDSRYKDWFCLNFDGDTGYGDGFWYEPWEGHFELVKLNLANEAVRKYLYSCVGEWVKEFDIDGIRLDVAYLLPDYFLSELRSYTDGLKEEFFLLGEILGGDYNRLISDGRLHSCTNYECRKGLYSSFQSMNLFEIGYSLNRQFGNDPWTLYRGKHLLSFVDNHDVDRVASLLDDQNQLVPLYGLLFSMPGIPCLYYGSEWGLTGKRDDHSDRALRPAISEPQWNDLTEQISRFAHAHTKSDALINGEYRQVLLTNRQLIFERKTDTERVLVAINAEGQPYHADFDAGCGQAEDLVTGELHDFGTGSDIPPYGVCYWKCER